MSSSKISSRFKSLNKISECFSDRGMARALMPGVLSSDEERTKAGGLRMCSPMREKDAEDQVLNHDSRRRPETLPDRRRRDGGLEPPAGRDLAAIARCSLQRPSKRQSSSGLRKPRAPRDRHLRASAALEPYTRGARTAVRAVRREARRAMAAAGGPQISFVRRSSARVGPLASGQ